MRVKYIEPRIDTNYRVYNDQVHLGPHGLTSSNRNYIQDLANEETQRLLGFKKKIHESNKKLYSLRAPAEFLHSANQDIERIGNELALIFNEELQKNYNRGMSIKEARKKALKYVEKLRKEKLKKHKEDFSKKNKKIIRKRLSRKNKIGALR